MARISPDDQLRRYTAAKQLRSPMENDWRMASAYCMPRHYGAWQTDTGPTSYHPNNAASRRIAYDSTGVRALPKYIAVLERLGTPHNMKWHGFDIPDKSLMKSLRVRRYLDETRDLLFRMRYAPRANFKRAFSEVYGGLGVYGTAPLYMGQRTPNALSRTPGFIYKACPLRDIFILVNDEGEVDTVFRRFFLTVRQFQQKFPNAPLPPSMAALASNGMTPPDTRYFEIVHCVHPRQDQDPTALDARRHPIVGSYLAVEDKQYIGDEHGYASLPYIIPRTFTEAGDLYGYSPAMQALPSLGTASAIKKTTLKQGQKAADPVILAHDDNNINGPVDMRPGHINYGAIDKQGRKLVQTLDVGNFQIGEKMLQDERLDIEDAFHATIFRMLMETPEMTATQVMDRVQKETALLSPTMGHIQSELLGPSIEREISVAYEMGLMPEMPPELREAQGQYEIIYTSPMAKGQYAEEVSGFMRAVETALQVVNATGDPSYLDDFNFRTALPEIADHMAVPARWMNDEKQKRLIKDERDNKAQQSEMIQNAGPIAGAIKAASAMQQGAQAK
jgi:hypothetical protein